MPDRISRSALLTALLPALLLAPGASAAPVSVPTDRGTLSLPAPARRVVALEYSFVDTLLALGVRPVGAALGTQGGDRGAPPYLRPKVGGITHTGSRGQPSLEAMAAARPDLILADALVHKDSAAGFARLAPTAVFPSRRADLDELNNQTLQIGRLVGREAAARQLLADQKTLIAKARAFARKNAPTFVAGVVTPTSFTVHTQGSFAVPVRDGQTQFETSLEGLVALNPQTPVLFTAPDEKPVTDTWAKNPLWQKLSTVKRGRVYTFDRDDWTRGRGPTALKLMTAQAIESRFLQDAAPAQGYQYQP